MSMVMACYECFDGGIENESIWLGEAREHADRAAAGGA